MKSCMRDCLPAVLFRNITSVMDDVKATDGSADYLGEKLCLEKKFSWWLSMLREPFREQHSSACWPCLCQAAHTTFYIQSPPLQRLVKRRHPPAGSCCFQLSEDKTAQQGEPDVWLPAKTMICVEGTVIPNVRCSLARRGSMPIPYNPRTCFPVEAATSTADFQTIDSPLWHKAKWNTQILLPKTLLWLEDLVSSSLVMFHTSWCMKTSEGGDGG